MPGMDGIEVIRHLAARGYSDAIALFSSEDIKIVKTVESLASAHQLKLIGSLAKPVTQPQVQAILDSVREFQINSVKQSPKIKPVAKVTPAELAFAISNGEIKPYFQPKMTAKDNRLVSAEVLARWCKPDGSVIAPFAFISVAEDHSLIEKLSCSIFEQAVKKLRYWRNQGFDFTIAVNISADNLENINLPEIFCGLATKYGVANHNIVLEVTETRLMKNLSTTLDVLARLKLKGFILSIDDFGTGYSSMTQLKQLPVSELKVDRAFVNNVSTDDSARAILESSVGLARKLGLETVAEGVENKEDWDVAVAVGCDTIQGYFISKPLSAEDFDAWLKLNAKKYNKSV
jgi:EAL domain-containing protein (putative c-di-GMP-specific phosphodiesterase class I)